MVELGTWLEEHTVPNACVNGVFSLEIEGASLANKIFIIHKIGCCVIAQNSEWNCSFDLLFSLVQVYVIFGTCSNS